MKHPELIILAGALAMLLGGFMRYRDGKARFLRRNPIGRQVFQTYNEALMVQTANRVGDRVGWWLLALGAMLLVSGMIGTDGQQATIEGGR